MYYDKSKIVAIYVAGQRAKLPVSNKPCTKVSSKVSYFFLGCRSISSECIKTNGTPFYNKSRLINKFKPSLHYF